MREETVCLRAWLCNSLRKLGISYLVGTNSLLASPGSKSVAKHTKITKFIIKGDIKMRCFPLDITITDLWSVCGV